MGYQLWGGLMFIFFFGNLFSLVIEGVYYGTSDVNLLSQLAGYNVSQLQGAGSLNIPKIGFDLVVHGIPKMIIWDYAFFEGGWAIVRFFLFGITSVPLTIEMVYRTMPALQGVFARFLGVMAGMITLR